MSTRSGVIRALALAVLGALALAACASGGDGGVRTDAAESVLFETAGSSGPDPFTDSVATSSVSAAQIESLDASAGPGVFEGNSIGLYGGTGDQTVCDTAQLVQFLETNSDKAQAWSAAQAIDASEIGSYVDDLTPVLLLNDTRVTNHGFKSGTATPRQATLETGTAVLIDTTGVPRVRCACGNPLAEPTGGESDSGDVTIIEPGPHAVHPPITDVDTGDEASEAAAEDFCSVYAAMKADVGGGPGASGLASIDAYVQRLSEWLSKLVTVAESTSGFPSDGLADLRAYRDATAAGPGGAGDTALRDRVESFLESYCTNPPPPAADDGFNPGDPIDFPDTGGCSDRMGELIGSGVDRGLWVTGEAWWQAGWDEWAALDQSGDDVAAEARMCDLADEVEVWLAAH